MGVLNSMASSSIQCGAELPGGRKCEEVVTVTNTRYLYNRNPIRGDTDDYILKQIFYEAVCPKCGERCIAEIPEA
jgi:hypothetical protein